MLPKVNTQFRQRLAKTLYEWRYKNGLTQRMVADKWRMAQSTICRCEAAKPLSPRMFYAISTALQSDIQRHGYLHKDAF